MDTEKAALGKDLPRRKRKGAEVGSMAGATLSDESYDDIDGAESQFSALSDELRTARNDLREARAKIAELELHAASLAPVLEKAEAVCANCAQHDAYATTHGLAVQELEAAIKDHKAALESPVVALP